LRLTRAGIFILLAVLVALLGANAKHSQFQGPPHGYLSKAVKMAGVRAANNIGSESTLATEPAIAELHLGAWEPPVFPLPALIVGTSLSLINPPLRT
jgi:hypothetical protein